MSEYGIVKSSELRVGDVVLTHGALCEVLAIVAHVGIGGRPDLVTYACDTRVTNLGSGDVDDMLARWARRDGGHWTIQGNDLCSWYVPSRVEVARCEACGHVWTMADGPFPAVRAAEHEGRCHDGAQTVWSSADRA